jgi:hypothetical protein
MNKMNKVLPIDSDFLSIRNNKNIDNKPISGIFCSLCYGYICIKVVRKSDGIFIKSKCENGHKKFELLKNFMKNYQKSYIKDCQICYSHININELYYCYSCSSKNIICIECRNKYHPKSNIKNEKNHTTILFTLRYNYCPLHNNINTYYCKSCKKYLCKLYDKKEHNSHVVLNLNLNKIINFKDRAKSIIEKEEKKNKDVIEKVNNIIIKIRNNLKEILTYKMNVIYLKRNIINSYKLSNWNYNNTKNLKFIRKHFYKKDVKSILTKINNSHGIRYNHFKSNNKKNDIKRNRKPFSK